MLRLHDLLKVYYVSYISYDEQFVFASSNIDIHLVQSDVLLVYNSTKGCFFIEGVHERELEGVSLLIFGKELPDISREVAFRDGGVLGSFLDWPTYIRDYLGLHELPL